VILVDSNIPMYLIGAPHSHKTGAQRLLERCISRDERLVTDAEVVQEILHRYVAIGRRDAIQPAFDALLSAVDEVFPVTLADTKLAKEIVLGWPSMSARDALHLAIMDRHGVGGILSFDRGFDAYPGVARIHD
jgi:predicted nucleic acid-binding protein